MLLDNVENRLGKTIGDTKFVPLLHMGSDDQGAHVRGQTVVGIFTAVLVLDEIFGYHCFPDIMIVRADTRKKRIRVNPLCRGFSQRADHEHRGECSRRFHRHFPEKGIIEIG